MDSGGLYQTPAIQGALPWGGGGGNIGVGGPVGQAYGQAYNSALQMNQSNYQNIMQGYQQALAQQSSAQAAIGAGYTNLYNNVLSTIKDTFGAQSTAINQGAAREQASGSQNLINSGLGNSTIMQSMNMGVESQRQQQQTSLTDQQAQMMGSYMSNLGLAGLQNQQVGQAQIAGTTQNQLGFMNSVQANYPNAGLYAQLAQQQAANKYGYGGGSFAGAGNPGPKVGYVPSAPNWGAGGGDPSAYSSGGAMMPTGAMPSYGGGSWNVPNAAWSGSPGSTDPNALAGIGGGMAGIAMGMGGGNTGGGGNSSQYNPFSYDTGGGGDF